GESGPGQYQVTAVGLRQDTVLERDGQGGGSQSSRGQSRCQVTAARGGHQPAPANETIAWAPLVRGDVGLCHGNLPKAAGSVGSGGAGYGVGDRNAVDDEPGRDVFCQGQGFGQAAPRIRGDGPLAVRTEVEEPVG